MNTAFRGLCASLLFLTQAYAAEGVKKTVEPKIPLPQAYAAESSEKATESEVLLTQADDAEESDKKIAEPKNASKPVCGSLPRSWIDIDYIFWKVEDAPEPVPLIVNLPDPIPTDVLNLPNTNIVLGGKDVDLGWRSGGRFDVGYRFGSSRVFGLEANYFFLPLASKKKTVQSADNLASPYFYVPYFDAQTNIEDSATIAQSGNYGGPLSLKITNKVQGAELNGLGSVFCRESGNVDVLGGFRYLNFKENLLFSTSTPYLPGSGTPVDTFQTKDQFDTKNNFYGAQLGVKAEYIKNWFFLNATGKLALGAVCGQVHIKGIFHTNDFNGGATTYEGAYFALPTNNGFYRKNRFSVIPEVNANFGFKLSSLVRLQLGYMFMYITNVFRPGKQIDREINPSQSGPIQVQPSPPLVGVAKPQALMKTTNLWIQGANAGLEFRF